MNDPIETVSAERHALLSRLAREARARTRLGDQVVSLTAENLELERELAGERERAARLAESLADRQLAEAAALTELQEAYDELVAALREEIDTKEVALRHAREGLTVSIVDRVLFPSGQTRLTAEGRGIIDAVGRVLAMASPGRIIIEGHTDDVPIGPELRARFPTNWELSTARATEVVRQLVERGVPPERLQAVGRAATRPVAGNDTEDGRRRNRRIEIIVSGSTGPAGPRT